MERYSALGVTGSGVGGFTEGFTGRLWGSVTEVVCRGEVEGGGVAVLGGVAFWAAEAGVEQVAWGGSCFLLLGSGDTRGQAAWNY